MVKVKHMMPEYESKSREQIVDLQFYKFKTEFERAWKASPFYKKKFSEMGLEPGDIKKFDDIVKVPKTTKAELVKDVEEHPPYGSRSSCPPSEIVCTVETSGTTGRGKEVHILGTEEMRNVILAEKYGFFFAGARKGTVFLLGLPVTMASAGYWWTLALYELQVNCLRIFEATTEDRLRYMSQFGMEMLVSNPSYLKRMEYLLTSVGINIRKQFPSLKSIILSGEPWTAEWARESEEKWGAKLYEQWGCTQRGFGWTCEYGAIPGGKRGILHFIPQFALCEVVNRDTGRPVSPGEEGELVVTPFGSGAFPLIRFSTNDKARFLSSDYCPCRRPFDGVECGTISRYDDMMKVKGVNFWPATADEVVFRHDEISEYRGEVYMTEDAREKAVVEIEFRGAVEDKQSILSNLAQELRSKIGIGFEVREWVGEPLSTIVFQMKTGKVKRWTDKRLGR